MHTACPPVVCVCEGEWAADDTRSGMSGKASRLVPFLSAPAVDVNSVGGLETAGLPD